MPKSTHELMTDAELCAALGISRHTLNRHLRQGPPRKRYGAESGDLRTVRHLNIGGQRRWVRKSVDEFIHGI